MHKACSAPAPSAIHDREAAFCQRLNVPVSTLAPDERMRQLMATRNEWKLYRRVCDATGAEILSAYPADSPFTVYKNDVWWGDSWEALDYGRDIDFSRPFFAQFAELQQVVPRDGTSVFRSENCTYNSHIRDSKNCYLNSLVMNCEDGYYCYWIVRSEDVFDCTYLNDSKVCYECIDLKNCYECVGLQDSDNCSDCYFSYQLLGCNHCLFCSNLANRSYCIANQPCTPQEFEDCKRQYLNGSFVSWQAALDRLNEVRAQSIRRPVHILNCENVWGDHFYDARNCYECYDGSDCEDCLYLISTVACKDVHNGYSVTWPRCELIYFSSVVRGCTDCAFCTYVWLSSSLRYCDSCQSCRDCFGCIGLRNKQYCIFNKQYDQAEYEQLTEKLIAHMEETGEWGQFFPITLSPFAYNESVAQQYFPLTKEEVEAKGWHWRDEEESVPEVEKVIPADQLPDSIDDVPDDVLNWAIQCSTTSQPFRILQKELEFYRRLRVPLPRVHTSERHKRRLALRNPHRLWQRQCVKCGKDMSTTYAPERSETVYCEECYLAEVY